MSQRERKQADRAPGRRIFSLTYLSDGLKLTPPSVSSKILRNNRTALFVQGLWKIGEAIATSLDYSTFSVVSGGRVVCCLWVCGRQMGI